MLTFHWGNTVSGKNPQGILLTLMLATLLFFKRFGSWCTDGIYTQDYMLELPLF